MTKKATKEKKITVKEVKPKAVKKSNLVDCVVLRSFFCTEQNLSLKKGDFYHATIERIEKVNNTMYQGKKLNALEIVKREEI